MNTQTSKTSKLNSLQVATLRGGDPNGLTGAIWTDLDSRPNDRWLVLVESQTAAEVAAHNTGAELVSVEEWDGERFGDGNIGTVTSPRPGVLVGRTAGMTVELPDGWEAMTPEEWEVLEESKADEDADVNDRPECSSCHAVYYGTGTPAKCAACGADWDPED